jgi:ApaG protein
LRDQRPYPSQGPWTGRNRLIKIIFVASSDEQVATAMYSAMTRSIAVSVEPFFVEDQSRPDEQRWVFGYRVTIANQGSETVQLLARHWRITDARGRMVEVRGEGVVGEQPRLEPGQSFEYTSGTPLPTPTGVMLGSYHMVTDGGEEFDVRIPPFSLDAPGITATLH